MQHGPSGTSQLDSFQLFCKKGSFYRGKMLKKISLWTDMIIPIAVIVIGGLLANVLFYWLKGLLDLPKKVNNLEENVTDIKKEQKEQKTILQTIRDALLAKGVIEPVTQATSPKEITQRGHKLLEGININEFLNNCDLVRNFKQFKDKSELDIFLECIKWVKNNGESKTLAIMYESNIPKEQCEELIALAIRDQIFKQLEL